MLQYPVGCFRCVSDSVESPSLPIPLWNVYGTGHERKPLEIPLQALQPDHGIKADRHAASRRPIIGLLMKLVNGGGKERATSQEESRLIQELYNGLGGPSGLVPGAPRRGDADRWPQLVVALLTVRHDGVEPVHERAEPADRPERTLRRGQWRSTPDLGTADWWNARRSL